MDRPEIHRVGAGRHRGLLHDRLLTVPLWPMCKCAAYQQLFLHNSSKKKNDLLVISTTD